MMRSTLALLAATAVSPVLAGVKEVWYNLTWVEDVNPDGLFSRRAIGVNGTWPPPPVDINNTDSLIVHAYNSLDLPATLHHHGMTFNSTSWMDGAMSVSQCGIPPGSSFDYVVPINTSDQHGTYWWHAHSNGQYVDGLRAPLVLHPETEKYAYDAEYTIVLGEWYHDEHSVLIKQFVNIANPGGAEPIPDSGLVYFAQNASYLPPISGTTSGPVGFNENATLPFEAGKTYRLRVVNVGGFAGWFFWIDGHQMQIIEADGIDTQPYPVDMLNLGVAQRYSVLVTARNDTTPTNWAIHANMDTDMFDSVPASLNPNVTTSITYDTSANLTDFGFLDAYEMSEDIQLVPLDAIPLLPAATATIEVEATFDTMSDGTNHAMFNLVTYNPPLVPAILSEMSLGSNATVAEAYGPLSFVVDHLDTFDIIIKNGDSGKHPFHLHGHQFQIINQATDYTSSDPTLNPPLNTSQPNPMRRDTILVQSGNSFTLRVVADNPGVWMFHCHIEWHLEVGLALEIIEAPLVAQERDTLPQAVIDQCAAQGLPVSGNAAGHASTTDLSGLPSGPYPQKNGWHAKGIGAMFGCVFTAVLGMVTVWWYTMGGAISEAEMEHEERMKLEAKEKRRGKIFGLLKKRE